MDIRHITDITTENDGMRIIRHDPLGPPILFYHDEIEKYNQQKIKWHWHPEVEFIIVRDNPVEILIDDARIVLRKDEGIWVNANKIHMMQCPENIMTASLFTIVMLPEFIAHKTSLLYQKYVQPWISDPELSYVLFLDSIPWHQEVIRLLTHTFTLLQKREFAYELSIHNDISQVWLMMLQHQKEIPKQSVSRSERGSQMRIKEMVRFIQENYRQHLTLEQIAAAAHVSKTECNRCFKKNLNVTPMQYLTEYRLEIAARLLTSSEKSVNNIAVQCGFDDLSYFAKLFRGAKGVTPSQYRKNTSPYR